MAIINLKKIPILFTILSLALLSLMIFQINWLLASKQLIEEQFDQKVNMAIGSTLSELNNKAYIPKEVLDLSICGDESNKYFSMEELGMNSKQRSELEETLQSYMSAYGIDEKYRVEIFDSVCEANDKTYCCSIGTLPFCKDKNTEAMLGISFGDKSEYLYDQMLPMILSSILIFLLLATVSFIILWSLVKQKRITENNIDFFNNTAHELKTPLTNISLALKLLGKKHPQIQEDRYAEIISYENSKLADQVDRVLYLSKMENGEFSLKSESINLKDLLLDVVDNFQLILSERSGNINVELPKGDVIIKGDYYHLSNVFKNLIDNAIKYCVENPEISISLTEGPHNVRLNFKDNGIGISAKDQDHIFEKFQRVNTGDVRLAKGFGIGLSYVKTVIELHKGLVSVQSDLKEGSQFQLLIPIIK